MAREGASVDSGSKSTSSVPGWRWSGARDPVACEGLDPRVSAVSPCVAHRTTSVAVCRVWE
jgi:hypothetical protein